MIELVVFVGLQGAGKSTFYRQRFAATHALVSKDLMPRSADKARRQEREVREHLSAGRSVVVDNTNATKASRAPLIALGREYQASLSCHWFDADPKECIARNHLRAGAARVPPSAIWMTQRKLEPPSLEEGFARIVRVRLSGDEFAVTTQADSNSGYQRS